MIRYILLKIENTHVKNIIKSKINEIYLNYKYKFVDESYINQSDSNDYLIMFSEINNIEDIKSAQDLRIKSNTNFIVFLSKNNTLIFDCMDGTPQFFIRLSEFENDLLKALNLIDQTIRNLNPILTFKTNTCILRLNASNIMYIESFGHYLIIHCTNGEYKIRYTISSIIEQLGYSNFLRIHKSYIVNLKFIKKVFHNKLIITDNIELPVGKSFKQTILDVLVQ